MSVPRHALLECDECHVVYGSETPERSADCRVCGGSTFTHIRNVRADDRRDA